MKIYAAQSTEKCCGEYWMIGPYRENDFPDGPPLLFPCPRCGGPLIFVDLYKIFSEVSDDYKVPQTQVLPGYFE